MTPTIDWEQRRFELIKVFLRNDSQFGSAKKEADFIIKRMIEDHYVVERTINLLIDTEIIKDKKL